MRPGARNTARVTYVYRVVGKHRRRASLLYSFFRFFFLFSFCPCSRTVTVPSQEKNLTFSSVNPINKLHREKCSYTQKDAPFTHHKTSGGGGGGRTVINFSNEFEKKSVQISKRERTRLCHGVRGQWIETTTDPRYNYPKVHKPVTVAWKLSVVFHKYSIVTSMPAAARQKRIARATSDCPSFDVVKCVDYGRNSHTGKAGTARPTDLSLSLSPGKDAFVDAREIKNNTNTTAAIIIMRV